MKLSVWEAKPEKEVKLALKKDDDGDIRLCVVDEDGNRICNILWVRPSGIIRLSMGAGETLKILGFKSDSNGSIEVVK